MAGPARLDRTLIRVSGRDCGSFLSNLITQDVSPAGAVTYAALLTPQGKIITDMIVWPDGDGLVLETDPTRGPDLLRRLSLYKLRAQVTLEDITGARTVRVSTVPFDGAVADPRLPALGWRGLGAPGDAHADWYDHHRLALGAPDLARDAGPDEVFALEALLEELHGVDFKKGCFIGQENVSRMKRRATTRKKFCPITFDGPPPTPGAAVTAGETELGTVRTGMDGRAIALLRLDRAQEALDAGKTLEAGGKPVRLAPPDWLILPQREG